VAAIGAAVGAGEIVARYTDAPLAALMSREGGGYLLLNAIAAAIALALVRSLEWSFGEPVRLWQVVVSGLGAMTVLRSSVVAVERGGEKIEVGPAALMQSFLDAADSAIGRARAPGRGAKVVELLEGLDYEEVRNGVLFTCQQLARLNSARSAQLAARVSEVESQTAAAELKRYMIGLELLDFFGRKTLKQAVEMNR
jgi:hypothetical protein